MGLACQFLGHRPLAAAVIWNNGYHFSRCERCDKEVIRPGTGRRWRDIPRGYRVEWKPMGEYDIRW